MSDSFLVLRPLELELVNELFLPTLDPSKYLIT